MKPQFIRYIYLVFGIINIAGHILSNEDLLNYSKPLLMPLLLYYVYQSQMNQVTSRTLLLWAALLFAWFGDLALMLPEQYFLFGVAFFFATQICYIILFQRSTVDGITSKLRPILSYLVYAVFLFYVLLPHVGNLFFPVLIYGLSLIGMAAVARLRKGKTPDQSYVLVTLGSGLFLISDSLLALNKFVAPLSYGATAIMTTYIAAQYLITEGILKDQTTDK